jgi:YqaJ-like viral recombinase domain
MGIPTASLFHRIVQPGGMPRLKKDGEPYKSSAGELAAGRRTYMYELAVERLFDQPRAKIADIPTVRRGKNLEPAAIQQYEFVSGRRTAKIGFITPLHGKWGCSPDRLLCDEPGGLEFKAPDAKTHLKYWNEGPGTDYRCQVQGSLMITGLPIWEFVSFHPNLPEVVVRFERDEPFIAKLEAGLTQFCAELDDLCERIRAEGFQPPSYAPQSREDAWRQMLDADPNLWGYA